MHLLRLVNLMVVCVVLLTVYLQTRVEAKSTTSAELSNKYGPSAIYILIHLYLFLENPFALETHLQNLRNKGQLRNYVVWCGSIDAACRVCRYLPQDRAKCLKNVADTDSRSTVIIVAYFNTVCCSSGPGRNGTWGTWAPWSGCSVTCGNGSQTRTRLCNNPPPIGSGLDCQGYNMETRYNCNTQDCPIIDGQWGLWSTVSSACSATCNGGIQQRVRNCDSPRPANGGKFCIGSSTDITACNEFSCPVFTSWGPWDAWRPCNVSCGGGSQFRARLCYNPSGCEGSTFETRNCNSHTCAENCGIFKPVPRIMGGNFSIPGRYPWLAMLLYDGQIICGCSILDEYTVLTAGHCLSSHVQNSSLNSNNFEVIAGQYSSTIEPPEPGAQRISIISGRRHEQYDGHSYWNDIAVLRLAQPLTFTNNVSKMCLPTLADSLPTRCTVAGWGRLKFTGKPAIAQKEAQLDVYDRQKCEQVFQGIKLIDGIICAANGTAGGVDACSGDSGGPLICLQNKPSGELFYSVYGIVSNGYGCGNPGIPGFYTYTPYYRDWIQNTLTTLA